jgi:hypothetical protein
MPLNLHTIAIVLGLALWGDGRRVASSISNVSNSINVSSVAEATSTPGSEAILSELLLSLNVAPSHRVSRSASVVPRGIVPSMYRSDAENGPRSKARIRLSRFAENFRLFFSSDEAKPFKQSLIKLRRNRGEDHPLTLMALSQYAMRLDGLGRPEEAEPLLCEVYERRKEALGAENLDTLEALDSYTHLLNKLGRHSQAEPLMRGALQVRRQVVGKYSPETLDALNDYADTLRSLNRSSDAAPLNKYVLDRCYRLLGPEHPETIRALRNFAGEDYGQLQNEFKAKDTIKAAVSTLTKDEPDWNLFDEGFKVIDQTGAELKGLDNFKFVLQFLKNLCRTFNARDQIVSQYGTVDAKHRLFDPRLELQWIVKAALPFGAGDIPLDIAAGITFHVNGSKADYLNVDSLALNGRPIQFLPITPAVRVLRTLAFS